MRAAGETSARNVPCERCRLQHLACDWDQVEKATGRERRVSASSCRRCLDDSVVCSGPSRKSQPPCASCYRARARCQWIDHDMCMRCRQRGLGVCPLPARPLKRNVTKGAPSSGSSSSSSSSREETTLVKSSPSSTAVSVSPPVDPLHGKRAGLDMLLRRAEMEALANQGQSRFAAIDFDLLGSSLQERVGSAAAAAVFDQLAFALKLHAGLKFCNSIVGQSDGVRRVRPIEDVTVGQWLSHRQTKSSIQADTLGSLNERYTGLLDALPLMDVHDSAALLQLVTVLRVMTKMGGTPVRGKVEEDIRRLLAYAITLVAAYLRNPGPGKGSVTDELWRRAMLQESAFQLALREAHLSVVTGNISLVPDAVFGMDNPETDPDNPPSRDAPLDPALLEPLLQMDDGPQLVDPSSYLRDVVIKPTMDLLFNLIRTISTAQPDNLCSLGCWRDVEDIFRVTDHISGQIRSATSVNLEGRLSNRNALRVLRTLLCVELCAVQSSVLLAVKVRRAGTRPMKGLAEEFVVANINRLGNGPEGLMSSDTPLAEVYHILDIVAFIHNLCRTSLPSALKAMSPTATANLKRNLKLASYWNPTPALLDFADD